MNNPLSKIEDDFGGDHYLDSDELTGYMRCINQIFTGDALLSHLLPIDGTNEFLDKLQDGLILFRLINFAVPGSLSCTTINTGDNLNIFQKTENLNIMLQKASEIGCVVVNIGARDFIDHRPIPMLGLLWQLIRVQLISNIQISRQPCLQILQLPNESLEDLMSLSSEILLLRWVNFLLSKRNFRPLSNLAMGLKNPVIFGVLLSELGATMPFSVDMMNVDSCSLPSMDFVQQIVIAADDFGVATFVSPKSLLTSSRMRFIFLAQIFNHCNGLEVYYQESHSNFDNGFAGKNISPMGLTLTPSHIQSDASESDFLFLSNRKLSVLMQSRESEESSNTAGRGLASTLVTPATQFAFLEDLDCTSVAVSSGDAVDEEQKFEIRCDPSIQDHQSWDLDSDISLNWKNVIGSPERSVCSCISDDHIFELRNQPEDSNLSTPSQWESWLRYVVGICIVVRVNVCKSLWTMVSLQFCLIKFCVLYLLWLLCAVPFYIVISTGHALRNFYHVCRSTCQELLFVWLNLTVNLLLGGEIIIPKKEK